MCVNDGGDVSDRLVINNRCEPPLEGRYVHVKLVGDKLELTLCEVEVYDTYEGMLSCKIFIENLILKKGIKSTKKYNSKL